MLDKSINDVNLEIAKLERQYLLSSRELHRLKAIFADKTVECDFLIERLRSHEKEYFITERKYRTTRNKIVFLKNKLPALGHNVSRVDHQLLASFKEIEQLDRLKMTLTDQLSDLENNKFQAIEERSRLRSKSDAAAIEIENAEAEKSKILDEISHLLSTVSQNKIQSEKELDQFSIDFARLAGEREQVRAQYIENKDRIDRLIQQSAQLEAEQKSLMEILEYEKECDHLRQATRRLTQMSAEHDEEISSLERQVRENKEQLDNYAARNRVQKEPLAALEDEIKDYDALLSRVQDKETAYQASEQAIESEFFDMERSFSHHLEVLNAVYRGKD